VPTSCERGRRRSGADVRGSGLVRGTERLGLVTASDDVRGADRPLLPGAGLPGGREQQGGGDAGQPVVQVRGQARDDGAEDEIRFLGDEALEVDLLRRPDLGDGVVRRLVLGRDGGRGTSIARGQ
jgi:hypothetical protein